MGISSTEIEQLGLVIEIGGMAVRVQTTDAGFLRMLEDRYAGFVGSGEEDAEIEFGVELAPPRDQDPNADVSVTREGRRWILRRGDFRAEWDAGERRGWIRQTANPYSIDAVLRIVHTLVLARQGGFLLHAASAIRNGKAFVFAGVSEAGKTTISRLAPRDVRLLTDEISYVRRQTSLTTEDTENHRGSQSPHPSTGSGQAFSRTERARPFDFARGKNGAPSEDTASGGGYVAYGTPFTGELAKLGENVSAPVEKLFLLAKGKEKRIDAVEPGEAVRGMLENVLFFAKDEELVQATFHAAFEFTKRVPVERLTFVPDQRVWELIG